jgi:hypothetical protein
MSTTGDQVMAPGETIELKDGSTVQVRYGYRELYEIEKEFGSIEVLSDALKDGFKGKFFSTLLPALAIGTRIPTEQLMDQLDPKDTTTHVEVFGRSLQQAFPQAPQQAEPVSEETTDQPELTGEPTTTSQSVVTTNLTSSSS